MNKPNSIIFILLAMVCVLSFSCQPRTTTTTVLSSEAKLSSLTFARNDSMPGLASATFTIEEPADTGIVYNIDSIDYGTRLDSVVAYFRFTATPAAAVVYTANDTISLVGTDTIDFTVQPVRLFVVSADLSTQRWYKIYVNVHKVDPDLYTWEQMAPAADDFSFGDRQTLSFWDELFLYVNDGINAATFSSATGANWSKQASNITTNFAVRTATVHKDIVACLSKDGKNLYLSVDGTNFLPALTNLDGYEMKNILFSFADSLWMVVRNTTDDSYHLAASEDCYQWTVETDTLPVNFPVSDYAATTFHSISFRERALIIGGYDRNGKILNTRWSAEVSYNGVRWINYTVGKNDFGCIAGAQLIEYNQSLLLTGGIDDKNTLLTSDILQSFDEGMTWEIVDSTKNHLPDTYKPRYRHSMFTDLDSYIYIVGGQSLSEVYSDVYRGKLASVDF